MVKKKKILFICMCFVLSLIVVYYIWRVLGSINGLYFGRNVYTEELFGKYLILNLTQLSCVCALLINIWTIYILCTNGQLQVVDRGQKYFNIFEIIYLVIDILLSIATYILIAKLYLVDVSLAIWTFITTLNIASIGFLGGSIIAKIGLRKKK